MAVVEILGDHFLINFFLDVFGFSLTFSVLKKHDFIVTILMNYNWSLELLPFNFPQLGLNTVIFNNNIISYGFIL